MAGLWSASARSHGSAPEAPPPVAPPAHSHFLVGEWRTLIRLPLLLARTPQLARAPRGNGSLVIDIPGWTAPEVSMAPLRAFLRSKGHDAHGWGMGTNRGRPESDALLLAKKVETAALKTGHPVALVGWSLGGVIAREVARAVPHAVGKVVTFGTPVVGGPTYTAGAGSFGAQECQRFSRRIDELDTTRPITTPITAIFTRLDRVVSWSACLDRRSPHVEHVEVSSTHIGMSVDHEVWRVVAERLAA